MLLSDAQQLAKELMEQHGLADWSFKFDRATRRFGATYHHRKLISLSEQLTRLNNKAHVADVLLHEIAHALVGTGHGHNRVWKSQARAIGCDGSRTYDSSLVKTPPKPFKGTCPGCHRVIEVRRRGDRACAFCCNRYNGGRYSEEFKFKWERV